MFWYNIKRYKSIIVIGILGVIFTPILLELLVFRNPIPSVISNGQWVGFWGSFIGGIIGGVLTLIAAKITINKTQELQAEQELNREKEERRKFTNEICDLVAKIIAEYENGYVELSKQKKNIINNVDRKLVMQWYNLLSIKLYDIPMGNALEREVRRFIDKMDKGYNPFEEIDSLLYKAKHFSRDYIYKGNIDDECYDSYDEVDDLYDEVAVENLDLSTFE